MVEVHEPSASRWQQLLHEAVRDAAELGRLLALDPAWVTSACQADEGFPLLVPRGYVARMRPGDPEDPLLRQVLPLAEERRRVPGFARDPVGDLAAQRGGALLQKYAGRVLLITTGACAVHCRYCFRRHYPYGEEPGFARAWPAALETIAGDPSVEEVLLSGGDPLLVADVKLATFANALAAIPHVRRLRLHTRTPVVLPERVDDALLAWTSGTRLTTVVVLHANHPNELDDVVRTAFRRWADAGVALLNQSVLLRGINDDVDVLAELSRRLLDARVFPYYLHQLDRVEGAAHFEVEKARGVQLIEALRARLPGYAVPRYVEEMPGETSKTVLA
ncbi:MAG: EF-P beta-lysylation protein EpmB [Planctomycetes bacterium]|nr:EF-P beta-lysylation protein EpmB [Planctomycetota bacterium]